MTEKDRAYKSYNGQPRTGIGSSQARARLSRKIGIPLSRSGRQRKIDRSVGCCWILLAVLVPGWWAVRFLVG
jgi:hypothetical protein